MRQEPSNHAWEEQEAKRDEAEHKAEEIKEHADWIKKILTETGNEWIIKNLVVINANVSVRAYIEDAILSNPTPRFDYLAALAKTNEIMNKWDNMKILDEETAEEILEREDAQDDKLRNELMAEARKEYDAQSQERERKAEQEECPHDEHDHGICLDCGLDIMDDLIAAAEFNADCREDR